LHIHHGPGYRVCFHRQGNAVVILLCGGDKSIQAKDIKIAGSTEWTRGERKRVNRESWTSEPTAGVDDMRKISDIQDFAAPVDPKPISIV